MFISRKKKLRSWPATNSTVPALSYWTALASATAWSPMALRVFSSRSGLGASSMTFWLRRWIEHSRSNRWTTFPCLSPSTWISTWRGLSMNFSMKMRSSPKLDLASARTAGKPSSTSWRVQATRMPLPPPPALALIITG